MRYTMLFAASRSTRYFGLGILFIVLVLFSGYMVLAGQRKLEAMEFFSSALAMHHVSERVTLGGNTYVVDNGNVSAVDASPISDRQRASALKVAYELALARRYPLLGIAGSDPARLLVAVDGLASVQKRYAEAQDTDEDAKSIANGLYPVRFLRSLAELERARLDFLESGSESDARAYKEILARAIENGAADSKAFRDELLAYANPAVQSITMPGLGGSITDESMGSTVKSIERRFSELSARAAEREACVSGRVEQCRPDQLAIRVLDTGEDGVSELTPILRARSAAVLDVYRTHRPEEWTRLERIVLDTNVCVGMLGSPQVYFLHNIRSTRTPFAYGSDIYFNLADNPRNATFYYLKKELGISYVYMNPLQFYVCPEVGFDMGRAYAIREVREFARGHPEIETQERATFLTSEYAYESAARAYVESLANTATSSAIMHDIEEVITIWNEKTAGLDDLVSMINEVDEAAINSFENGVPVTIDARWQYLTHSAFPSLFLGNNPHAGETYAPLLQRDEEGFAELHEITAQFSDVPPIPRSVIEHDMYKFLVFEQLLDPEE